MCIRDSAQAAQGAGLKAKRHRHRGLKLGIVVQARNARRQSGDRPAEPFEIMKTMTDEIAEHAAAVVAYDFPIAHAHLDGAALDMPMHGDMTELSVSYTHLTLPTIL